MKKMSRKSRFTAMVLVTAVISTLIAFSVVARPDLYEKEDAPDDGE